MKSPCQIQLLHLIKRRERSWQRQACPAKTIFSTWHKNHQMWPMTVTFPFRFSRRPYLVSAKLCVNRQRRKTLSNRQSIMQQSRLIFVTQSIIGQPLDASMVFGITLIQPTWCLQVLRLSQTSIWLPFLIQSSTLVTLFSWLEVKYLCPRGNPHPLA